MFFEIKLLVDLSTLKDSAPLGVKVPREMLSHIQTRVPCILFTSNDKEILEGKDHTDTIHVLEQQTDDLYFRIEEENRVFLAYDAQTR